MKKFSIKIEDNFYFNRIPFVTSKFIFLYKLGFKRNSYMYNTFKKVYDFFCKNAINLQSDYKKYYKNEFDSFEKYLEIKHNLTSKEIFNLNNKYSCYKNITMCSDWNALNLFYDERCIDFFSKFFGGDFNIMVTDYED